MAVPFKNVTVLVEPLEQHKMSNNVLDNIGTVGAGVSTPGFLDMMTQKEAYETFNVVLDNAAGLDLEITDAAFYDMADSNPSEWQFTVTATVGINAFLGTVWRIVGRPMIYDDNLPLDHAHFLVVQTTDPITDPAVPA